MRALRSASVVLALTLIVGCSGSGGGGTPHVTPTATPTPTVIGTAVTVNFGTEYAAPAAIAVQFGTGTWSTEAVQGHSQTFTVPTGTTKYAIAYVCTPYSVFGNVAPEYVIEATLSDPTTYAAQPCGPSATTGTVTGSVNAAAIAGTTQVAVLGNDYFGETVTGASGNFSTTMLPGVNDIAAVAEDATYDTLGVKIVRNQSAPGAIAPITLAATDATTTQSIAVTNISAGFNPTPAVDADYVTSNGTVINLMGQNVTTTYAVVPATEIAAGDYYSYESNNANLTTHQNVGITENTTTGGGATSLALPAPWLATAPAAALYPSFTFNYTGFAGDASVPDIATIFWSNGSTTDSINVWATAAYQGASTALAVPNLTTLTGFIAPAPAAATVSWSAYAYGASYPVFGGTIAPSNSTFAFVETSGSYTQP